MARFRLPRLSMARMVLPLILAGLIASLTGLAGCGSTADAYGGSQNHVHDILALAGVPHTVLVATHIGLYRSADGGTSWTEVAGGAGQAMDGLMLYKLAQSPTNPQRLYVLAIPRPDNPKAAKGTIGIYTSADAGKTWSLAAPATDFPSSNIFSIATGAQGDGQIYAIVPTLGNRGVYVSNDTGHTWHVLATLPTGAPTGLRADPTQPNTLFLWSISDGLFVSTDGGATWNAASGVTGGVYSVAATGANVYVMGDEGFARSEDGGATFTMVDNLASYSAIQSTQAAPSDVYALTGTSVLVSANAGANFHPTATMSQHPTTMSVDPRSESTVYVAYSYPVGVAVTTNSGQSWHTVLP